MEDEINSLYNTPGPDKSSILRLVEHYHKLKLFETEEVAKPTGNKTYIVIVADDAIKIKLFYLYLGLYLHEADLNKALKADKSPHVGIDYEFNKRQIALMQINFERTSEPESHIWIVNPGEFDQKVTDQLHKMLTHPKIYKILHGPDSLDIPFMYDVMFARDTVKIKAFTAKVIDTRFLCEYVRISLGLDKKCSIYDALLYFGVITSEKYAALEQVHEDMGPVQDISWTIHKMSSYHLLYALYDVLFLKHYLLAIFAKIQTDTPQYVDTYKYIIALTRFTFLERNEITSVIAKLKAHVDPVNNFMIFKDGKPVTLINIYNEVIKGLKIRDGDNYIDMEFLLSVGYFAKLIGVLFKYVVYSEVAASREVFETRTVKLRAELDPQEIYKLLEAENFTRVSSMVKVFSKEAVIKINNMY